MLLISAHILDPFRILQSFRKSDKGMDINPDDKTSYSTQYPEAFLKCMENEYCTKHGYIAVNKLKTVPSSNLLPSATSSEFYQSSFDLYDLSDDNEE
jgi:hypothetical protein